MTVLGEILTRLSLVTSPSLFTLALYKPPDSSWWVGGLLCSPLHWLRSEATFLNPPSCLCNFLFRESQDFGQQHLYVIFNWPSTHSPKYIANNSAGGSFLPTSSLAFILWDALRWPIWWMSAYLIGLWFSFLYSLFSFTFHFHALEKEMATHSSVLAWRIPGTGEPGGLPSMGSHRVGHDWRDLATEAVISDAEHLFMCLSAICRLSSEKHPF